MNITSLSGLNGLSQQSNIQKASAKLSATIAAIVSSNKQAGGGDISSLSVASQLQAGLIGLKQASTNLAQASSLGQVADGGLAGLQAVTEQLQTLAQTAGNPTINKDLRASLDQQFKELTKQLDNFVANTNFGGKPLLDGSFSLSLGDLLGGDDAGNLSFGNFGSASLLGGNASLSADGLFSKLGEALQNIVSARADVGSFLQATDFAAANIDSAIANQDAARSTLSDTDIADASSQQAQLTLQQNIGLAIAAQGNRLTPALVKLVS